LSDLRHLPPAVPTPPDGGGPRRPPHRAVVLVAGLVALALVATLVFVLVRPGGGAGPAPGRGDDGATAGGPTAVEPEPLEGEETSAGQLLGWGEPTYVQTFDEPLGPEWKLYDGPGHGGNGVRSPEAITVEDGRLVITGDSEGTTGGMALDNDQLYGRWEGRVRAPASDETYNALLILWPEEDDWPQGGEVDFMEMTDPTRQRTKMFVHYVEEELKDSDEDLKDEGRKIEGEVAVDGTEWHNWAVEWTPEGITAFLDGREWFRTTDQEVLPPRPMHLTIQLDWFPEQGDEDDVQESTMEVDWVKQYAYEP
jgi:beta-glucanase (GH16 family)